VSKNGDASTGDQAENDAGGGGAVPKLTMGQRVLASLPNLQKQAPPAADRAPGTPQNTSQGPTKTGAKEAKETASIVTPDEVLAPEATTAAPRRSVLDTFFKPAAGSRGARPARGAPSGMTAEELTHVIKRIDDREQFLAYATAGLGLIVGIILTAIAVHLYGPVHAKNHQSVGFIIFFEGGARVLFSALVAVAAWRRRRSFVAFSLLFLGTVMGFLFALPFWALGLWMIFRVLKLQRELATLTGSPGRSRPEPVRTRGREAAAARQEARDARVAARRSGGTSGAKGAGRVGGTAGTGRRGKKAPEPTGPSPNKRYTPPKPTRQP
jgi:hypothetical protein